MSSNRYYRGASSDHFDGTRFFNPGQPSTDRSLAELLRWRFGGTRTPWPTQPPRPLAQPSRHVDDLTVTMVGHASVLIQAAGRNILVDPVWSDRASPVRFAGPKRANPPGIAFDALPTIDLVLITHTHYDHLDADTLRQLWARDRPRIVAALGTDTVIAGIAPGCRPDSGDWGERFPITPGLSVTLHPAYHWSARRLADRRMALWCGFVLQTAEQTVYIAGDTGYGDGAIFRQVRDRFGPPDLAILPIGAYDPRWFLRDQHIDPAEAVRILLDCGAAQGLGVHWGTFQLTDEPRLAPPVALREACDRHGVPPGRFLPLAPGEVWTARTDH